MFGERKYATVAYGRSRPGKKAPSAIELANEKLEDAIEQLRQVNEALRATGKRSAR